MRLDAVIDRIGATVPALSGRVEGAAELSALVKSGNLPQQMPAAFVLPLGLRGGQAEAATGIFIQSFEDTISVVIVEEAAGDATGAIALPTIDTLAWSIIAAVCGWAPGDEVGVFRLARGQLVSLSAGAVIYQLDFAIQDQLRIT